MVVSIELSKVITCINGNLMYVQLRGGALEQQ